MKRLFTCRRTYIATLAIATLGVLGWRGADVASAVAAVAIGLAGANAGEAAAGKWGRRLIETGPVNASLQPSNEAPISRTEGGQSNGIR